MSDGAGGRRSDTDFAGDFFVALLITIGLIAVAGIIVAME